MVTLGHMDTTMCNVWEACSTCIPVGVNDVLKTDVNVLVSNKYIRLETSILSQVDGIEIFDLMGKKVFSSNGTVLTNKNIDVNLQGNTLYLIRVNNANSYNTIKTIIKN